MISRKIVESAKFIKMPVSSQNLYFHLLINADDDGVVEAFPVINLIRANEDDLRVLVSKGFVQVLNEDLVSFIVDWRVQNTLRADRKIDSIYKDLLLQINPDVELLEMKERSDTKGSRLSGPSTDSPWTAQYSIREDNTDKDNTKESNSSLNDKQFQRKPSRSRFCRPDERQYDYDALEKKLFNNGGS